MNKNTEITDTQIQQSVRASEDRIDRQSLNALAEVRAQALETKPTLFGGYKGYFSAGLATALLLVVGVFPLSDSLQTGNSFNVEIADENIQLLLEDPDFLLWVSNSDGVFAQ